ncbi:MAG TPA: glycosyltransferase family 1 protein [Gemmataceae bacterium]|nr:glycosyltransferase family 1 protein [Gemmataceae bacterium]
MRIVFNRQPTLGSRTGIGHYAAELVNALTAQSGLDEIHVYPTGWMWRMHARLTGSPKDGGNQPSSKSDERRFVPGAGLVRRVLSVPAVRGALRSLQPLKFRHFQAVCRRERYDLYHEPNILPMPCECPTIATLHDLSAIAHPEWHPADRVKQYQRHLERALDQCTHFLTGSDFTREEIIRELGVSPERVTRVYHGIRAGLMPLAAAQVRAGLMALDLPPSYLLHVGTLEPRKNLEMLVRAYCSLPDAVRGMCPLLLVGKWGWNTAGLARQLEGDARQRGVFHLGYLAEEHLALLYNGARALVYPSHYEGFGLPPLEMMACGGAVLASTAGSVAEVVGPCGQLIDAEDEDGWREAMGRLIVDEDWVRELRRGVREWAAPFTWRRCATETFGVYRSILQPSTMPLAA